MDGYTATGLIRANPQFATLPVIAMTAHAMAGDVEKSAAAGMNDHVAKPIDPDHLFETLVKWVAAPRGSRTEARGAPSREADAESPTFPATLDGFELAAGLRRLGGNQALYRKLLANFAAGYGARAQEIRRALDAGDYDTARSLAHDVKGLAGNLAATRLQSAAGAMETLVKGGDRTSPPAEESLREALAALETELERALRAARSLAPADGDGERAAAAPAVTAAGLSPELAGEAARRLREAAEMGDVSAVVEIARELVSRSRDFMPYQQRITRLADDFDIEGVLALAGDLETGAR
jgi:CheY-like chemotaxis protein